MNLSIKSGWSRASAARARADGNNAGGAATFNANGIMGAGVLVTAGPNGAQIDSLQSSVLSGNASYANAFNRTFVVAAPGDPTAVINAVAGLPVQVGSLGAVSVGLNGLGPQVPDLSTGQVIGQAGTPSGSNTPNGLTVLLDMSSDRSGNVTSGGNATANDIEIHFSSREGCGLLIPAGWSAMAVVVVVGYLDGAVASASAFPLASITITGGDLLTPNGQGPTAQTMQSLARFLATVRPPAQ